MSIGAALATIAAGGGAAVIRYLLSRLLAPKQEADFGWAVLAVNVVGSALAGVAIGLAQHAGVHPAVLFIVLSGVCGGLTTYSTFSVEIVQLVRLGRWRLAAASVAANLVLGGTACAVGYLLGGGVFGASG